jgi:hypothetical protein
MVIPLELMMKVPKARALDMEIIEVFSKRN